MKANRARRLGSVLSLFVLLSAWSVIAASTWNNTSGDKLWSTPGNWSAGIPNNDTAIFDTTVTGTNIVDSDRTVANLFYASFINGTATHYTYISGGCSLTASSSTYIGFDDVNGCSPTGRVNVIGDGTLRLAGSVFVGGRNYGGAIPNGTLSLNGVTLLASNLNNLCVGYNDHGGGPASGVMDLRQAAGIQSGSNPNSLVVNNTLLVGYLKSDGQLYLPASLTNIYCGNLSMGVNYQGGSTIPYSCLDLGTNPALTGMTIAGTVEFHKARIIYSDGSNTKTGFPPNVAVRIGSPGAPGNLKLASAYATECDARWGGFRRFEASLNQLYLGVAQNSYTDYGELDLTDTNTVELAGSFTSGSMNVHDVRMGGGDANGTGVLKLPPTVTNISVGILHMGYMGNLSHPPDSVVNLGSNSLLHSLNISNEFRIGLGHFQYINSSGNVVTGTPPGLLMRVGSPTARASTFFIGDDVAQGCVTRFGHGVTDFEMYVANANVGRGYGGNHNPFGLLDLSSATNMVFNVSRTFEISQSAEAWGYAYLSGGSDGGRGSASNLYLNTSGGAWAAHLVLSNVQFAVSNEVVVKSAPYGAKITNYVDHVASGIDLGSTNLTLPDGAMHIVFNGDPPNQVLPFWGLRLKGAATNQIASLTTTPAKVTFDISGLSAKYKARFGVFYDPRNDTSILGIPALLQGTTLVVR